MINYKSKIKLVFCVTLLALMLLGSTSYASASDYYVYSNFDTGVGGSYGVDGFKGSDGVERIIFYSGSTAYIYKVTIPEGADPNLHPNNPEVAGDIAPRTFTLDKTFDLGVLPGHDNEFFVDTDSNTIYLGAAVGINKYVYNAELDTYVFDSVVAPPSPESTQSLAYDKANNIWYAGDIAWDTPKNVWKYNGNQGNAGTWELAFSYQPPGEFGSHHDGMEFINGYLYLADYSGDNILQYTPDGSLVNVFVHEPLNHELEGMGYGALGHFWVGSHGTTITEFGGGRLQDVVEDPTDPPVPTLNGRMTGGGSIFADDGTRITHGFTISSVLENSLNNLQVNWGIGNKFHLTKLTKAELSKDTNINAGNPAADFNVFKGNGIGSYNGIDGYNVEFVFTDAGEPGSKDFASIIIKDADGNVVLKASGNLDRGNQQAHAE